MIQLTRSASQVQAPQLWKAEQEHVSCRTPVQLPSCCSASGHFPFFFWPEHLILGHRPMQPKVLQYELQQVWVRPLDIKTSIRYHQSPARLPPTKSIYFLKIHILSILEYIYIVFTLLHARHRGLERSGCGRCQGNYRIQVLFSQISACWITAVS